MLKAKIKRDKKKNLSKYIILFLTIFITTSIYTGIKTFNISINKSIKKYHKYNNIQDINAYGLYVTHDLKRINEYEEVEDANVVLTLPDLAVAENKEKHKIQVNFLLENTVSIFNVVDGEDFAYRRKGIWIDSYYAKENNLKVGDEFNFKYNNILFKEKILGLITVPDKIYEINEELLPNHKEYTYVYLSKHDLPRSVVKLETMKRLGIKDEKEFDKKVPNFHRNDFIRYNKIIVKLFDKKDYKIVKEKIKLRNHTNNVKKLKDEKFYKKYNNDLNKLKKYTNNYAILIMITSIIIIIFTLINITNKEQREITILKEIGFKKRRIIFNYLISIFKLTLFSSLLGILFGYFITSTYLLKAEIKYIELPYYNLYFEKNIIYISVLLIIITCMIKYILLRRVFNDNNINLNINLLNITKKEIFNKLNAINKLIVRNIIINDKIIFISIFGIISSLILIISTNNMIYEFKNYESYKNVLSIINYINIILYIIVLYNLSELTYKKNINQFKILKELGYNFIEITNILFKQNLFIIIICFIFSILIVRTFISLKLIILLLIIIYIISLICSIKNIKE